MAAVQGQRQGQGHGQQDLSRYAWLSICAGVVVLLLKLGAWGLTGSVGLLSDALESTVNIAAAGVALVTLKAAARPGNQRHHFGLSKVEYFSALVEGLMILVAAGAIIATAVPRLLHPEPIDSVAAGLAVSVVASIINGAVAWKLLRAGRRHRSIVLVADAKHLLADVWTSAGVLVAVAAVALTGWERLDPIIAIGVAANIIVTGIQLISSSTMGLLDVALPDEENAQIVEILRRYQSGDVRFHALQTRESGRQRFISMHVLVPGDWSVTRGHDLVESVEEEIRAALPDAVLQTHMEPIEDPRAWTDQPSGGVTVPEEELWSDT